MFTLDVTTDDKSGIAGYLSGLRSQLPFATSVAINDTLNQVQTAVQKTLSAEFTLRRESFIKQSVFIGPSDRATKDRLAGTVRINPDRNFLAKFEDGGQKTSVTGKSLAIPIIREDNPSLIVQRGDPLSVTALLAAIQESKGGKQPHFRDLRRKGQPRINVDANRVFLVTNGKGTFILQRVGAGRAGNRVLYWFRKEVPIPANLHFESTAMSTAVERWAPNFDRALEFAIMSMR
jgi:hypothetical protein